MGGGFFYRGTTPSKTRIALASMEHNTAPYTCNGGHNTAPFPFCVQGGTCHESPRAHPTSRNNNNTAAFNAYAGRFTNLLFAFALWIVMNDTTLMGGVRASSASFSESDTFNEPLGCPGHIEHLISRTRIFVSVT